VRIVLVGDSTVTTESGWGLGLEQLVSDRVDVVNAAAGGRSSKSYVDEGRWSKALALKGHYYVIQFGHNDQPGKGPERETDPLTTYPQYLARYVDEARAIGAKPVLVTSLTRRNFSPDGRILSTLTPYADAMKKLAREKRVPVVDLHASSIALAERLGDAAWAEYSPRQDNGDVDRTHLNARGSLAVARLVLDELRAMVPSLADAVVAADGSGQYRTVQEAINAVPQNTTAEQRWVIFVKAGTYREIVYVQREKRYVTLAGEGAMRTRITHDLHANMAGLDGKPIDTFRTPTVQIDSDDFRVENLTLENAAGPVGQALAVRVDGARVAFRNCRFLGWQDTVFLNRGRHTFEDSYIEGHVDFIFGGATAFFDRCHIHCLRDGYITAASTPPDQAEGFVFRSSRITGAAGVKTYLGRPWRDHAAVAFIDTEMSDVVRAEGWHNWDRPERETTVRFSEVRSRGPGASPKSRVPWASKE
jgi:pectinesterase